MEFPEGANIGPPRGSCITVGRRSILQHSSIMKYGYNVEVGNIMERIKRTMAILALTSVYMLLLVAATSAYGDVYRVEAEVSWAACVLGPYCSMLESLSISPGSTIGLLFSYDPDATPDYCLSGPNDRVCRYPLGGCTLVTAAGVRAPIMTTGGSLWLNDAIAPGAGQTDYLAWRWHISDDPCPAGQLCFHRLDGSSGASVVELMFADTNCVANDYFALSSALDVSTFDSTSAHIQILRSDNPDLEVKVQFEVLSCARWAVTDMIAALVENVMTININQGISNSLDGKLSSALEAMDDANESNDVSAINRMQAFINAVEAQRGNQITEADADNLIAAAQEIITELSTP